jgi:hypothetical protein
MIQQAKSNGPVGFRLGFFNQAVRAPLNFIAKRLHNFVARLFAFLLLRAAASR